MKKKIRKFVFNRFLRTFVLEMTTKCRRCSPINDRIPSLLFTMTFILIFKSRSISGIRVGSATAATKSENSMGGGKRLSSIHLQAKIGRSIRFNYKCTE